MDAVIEPLLQKQVRSLCHVLDILRDNFDYEQLTKPLVKFPSKFSSIELLTELVSEAIFGYFGTNDLIKRECYRSWQIVLMKLIPRESTGKQAWEKIQEFLKQVDIQINCELQLFHIKSFCTLLDVNL